MRIAFTSDTHIPTTSTPSVRKVARQIAAQKPDVLILGGDLGETSYSLSHYKSCLKLFRREVPNAEILVVCGNHDLWIDMDEGHPTGITSSIELFEKHLPEITRATGCEWLEGAVFTYGPIAIIGSYLHYDYSSKDPVGPFSMFADEYFKVNKLALGNADGRYLQGIDDIEFATKLTDKLKANLDIVQADPSIEKIVIATHVPCMEEQMTRKPHDGRWSAGTAFFGNLACDAAIRQASKVSHVVSGHSHQLVETSVGNIQVHVLDADYRKPKFLQFDI